MWRALKAWWQRRRMRRQDQRWEETDRQRRRQIEQTAFAAGRFVLYLAVGTRIAPVCFTPREDEAAEFFSLYVVPWMRGDLRWFCHSTWEGLPGMPVVTRSPYTEVFKGHDIRYIAIVAETQEYRARLDLVLRDVLHAADKKAEAERLAERSAAYTMTVAAMRDAYTKLEGGEGPR